MKTFQQFITEMAQDLGGHSYIPLDRENKRTEAYARSKDDEHHSYPVADKNIVTHKKISAKANGEKQTEYNVNDHNKKETIFQSRIVAHGSTKKLPFRHEEQTEIHKQTGSNLPRGFGRDHTYNHFKNSDLPLRSSDTQFHAGHKMWSDITHRALDDGHHVYFHNGNRLIKSNKDNIDQHIKSSFGGYGDDFNLMGYQNKHMIISKKELDV